MEDLHQRDSEREDVNVPQNTSLVHELTQIKDRYSVGTYFFFTPKHTPALSAHFGMILWFFILFGVVVFLVPF